jgi:hyaluronan synthase
MSRYRRGDGEARPSRSVPLTPAVLLGVIAGGELGMHLELGSRSLHVDLPVYGYGVLFYLAFKLGLAILYRPSSEVRPPACVVAGIITVHNEDPLVFMRCLDSILAQTRLPQYLTIVDDGSREPDCLNAAHAYRQLFHRLGVYYHVIHHPRNLGKREGLAAGFQVAWHADVYLCIDSDTVLREDAVQRSLVYFNDPRVQAVTGCVLALNWNANLLTRLIDLRYANAFLGERAAYSTLGSMLCCCGSLALYRGPVVRKYLGDFLNQTFLGNRCTYGDDRRLTYYCLREGRTVLAPDAVAWTMVPENMGHFLRQQLRWSKSFIRESWCMITTFPPTRICWWLSLMEITTWGAFTSALVYTMVARPILTGKFAVAAYLAATLLLAYARSGHYLRADHPDSSRFSRCVIFMLAPVYGLVHMILLLPLRVVALCTLRDNSWGTRTQVEVTAA